MTKSEIRHTEELVDAVIVGMADGNEDELFEAFHNRPHGLYAESICGKDFERQSLSQRCELEAALTNSLDDKGRKTLSEYIEFADEYWSTYARRCFDLGVRLGRVLERQREVERMLAGIEARKTAN